MATSLCAVVAMIGCQARGPVVAPAPPDAATGAASVTGSWAASLPTGSASVPPLARGVVSHGVLFGAEWPAVDEASLAACYREALASDPTITGWVLVDGSHAGVSVKDSRGVPRSLANCAATTFLPASLVEGHGRVYVRFR